MSSCAEIFLDFCFYISLYIGFFLLYGLAFFGWCVLFISYTGFTVSGEDGRHPADDGRASRSTGTSTHCS